MVDVDRLDRVAGEEVDGVQRLPEAQQVLVVLAVADAPPTIEVRHVRRRADRPERHPVAAELEVARRVPGVERERRGGRPDRLGDHVRVEPHALRVGRRVRARPPAAPRARPDPGSPSRSRTGPAATRRGSTRARPRRGPRSGRSAGAAGPTAAAGGGDCRSWPARPPVRRRLKALARGRVHVRHVGSPRWRERAAPDASLTFAMLAELILAAQPADVADEGDDEVDQQDDQQTDVDPRVIGIPSRQDDRRVSSG